MTVRELIKELLSHPMDAKCELVVADGDDPNVGYVAKDAACDDAVGYVVLIAGTPCED